MPPPPQLAASTTGLVAMAACFVIAVVLVLSSSSSSESAARLANTPPALSTAAFVSFSKLPEPVCVGFCLPKPGAEESSVRSCVTPPRSSE